MRDSWRLDAMCRGADQSVFFPIGPKRHRERLEVVAKAFCEVCPVTLECLIEGIETGDDLGVRAGLSVEERSRRYRGTVRQQVAAVVRQLEVVR